MKEVKNKLSRNEVKERFETSRIDITEVAKHAYELLETWYKEGRLSYNVDEEISRLFGIIAERLLQKGFTRYKIPKEQEYPVKINYRI